MRIRYIIWYYIILYTYILYTTHGRNNNDNNTVLSDVINGVYTPRGTFGDFFLPPISSRSYYNNIIIYIILL